MQSRQPITYALILLLVLSSISGVFASTSMCQASFVQSVNLNQHILWQYSYSGVLRFIEVSSAEETIAFVTGIEPSTLIVLDGVTGQFLWEFRPTGLAPENRTISGLSLSANGEYLVIGTTGGSIYLFHRSSSEIVQHWQTNIPITAVAISELGTFIAIAFAGYVYFLSRLEGTPLWGEILANPPYIVTNMTMDRSGTNLAASTTENKIYFLRTGDGVILWERQNDVNTTTLELNPAGTLLFTTTRNDAVLFTEEGGIVQQFPITPRVFTFSGDSSKIAIISVNTVYVYNTQPPTHESNRTFIETQITSLAFTFDGGILLLGTLESIQYALEPSSFNAFWTLPLGDPIIQLLTPDMGDFFLAATTTTLIGLRIASITGVFTSLLPLVLIILTSAALSILTFLLVRPKRPRRLLVTETDE
ncbi:MAG: WD40 repeat domain-containing protein [Candidatus Hodarchaeota archaeon]